MDSTPRTEPGGVWHVDFEYEIHDDGSLRRPFLMAAHHHESGRTLVLWGEDLTSRSLPPFPVDDRTIVVCHNCEAEAACFEWLGWPRPRFVDTMIEFRLSPAYADLREEDAMRKRYGRLFKDDPRRQGVFSLNGMSRALGVIPHYADEEKHGLQTLAGTGGPFDGDQKRLLKDYCVSDALMTRRCLPHLIRQSIDWAAASLRADFALLNKKIEARGIPVWVAGLLDLLDHRADLRACVIREWDRYGLFQGGSFSNRAFVRFLGERGLPWPYHEASGQPDLRGETFREQARIHPVFAEIGRLRDTVAMFKGLRLRIDPDGRVRCELRPFAAKTSRSQPGNASCLFLLPKFMRKFVVPPPGWRIVQCDYSQQEVLVAAILSGDATLLQAYREGDCYVGLGKQLGMIPPDGTRERFPTERNRCKPLLLGLLYRMGAESLAARLKIPRHEATSLHRRLRRTFATYFEWSEAIVATTRAGNPLVTPLGWRLHPRPLADSSRTRTNFLVQSASADVLRASCLLAEARGLELIMTVHDSLIIQGPEMSLPDHARALVEVMKEAAVLVLGDAGSLMRVDRDIVLPGQSLPLDPSDENRFSEVQKWLSEIRRSTPAIG
jgi:hypothetical protein